ncbi:MAG: hypothetical protein HFG89_01150 [Dorea sp.]|jgi:hypothetical protein|nr:hypothetical protein [Dorea sp.]
MNDLLVCDHFSCIKDSDIVIYGSGYWGEQILSILEREKMNIAGVCNTERGDVLFHGYSVLSIKDIKEEFDRSTVLIIISSMDFFKEMAENCKKQNFLYAKVCTLYAFFQSIFIHYEDLDISDDLRNDIVHNLAINRKRIEHLMKLYTIEMLVDAAQGSHIFIYQPGKVGSQSVWKAIGDDCIQIHSLTIPFGNQEFTEKQLKFYLDKIRNKKVKIITGVREPISRDLAAMFQNSDIDLWPYNSNNSNVFWFYGDYLKSEGGEIRCSELGSHIPRWRKSLETSFFELSELIMEYRLDEFSWFSYEIKRVFGIDVYQSDFDKRRGYGIIRKGNVEIFIYKLEALNSLEHLIGEFLGRRDFSLKNINLSEEKVYNFTYQELKKKIKISDRYFQYYYDNNQEYSHFYTDEEINYYRKIWGEHVNEGM